MRCIVAVVESSAALLPQVTYHEVRYPSPVLDPEALTSGSVDSNGRFDARRLGPGERPDPSGIRVVRKHVLVGDHGRLVVALVFAYYLVREVLAAPEGTEKMKEIAKAIQEGAKAYLSRQFRTLAVFLGILTVDPVLHPAGTEGRGALGVLDQVRAFARVHPGRGVQRHDRLRRDVARRPRERPHGERRARVGLRRRRCGSRSAPAAWPGCSRSGSACFGATVILLIYKQDATSVLVGLRVRRRAARDVHAGGRRHLHEGGRRRRRPGGQGRAGDPRGRPAQRRDDRRQRRRQRRRLRRHGGRPVRVLRGHAGRLADPGRGRVRRLDDRRDRRRDVPAVRARGRRRSPRSSGSSPWRRGARRSTG